MQQFEKFIDNETHLQVTLKSGVTLNVTPIEAMSEVVFFDVDKDSRDKVEGLEEIGFEYLEIASYKAIN